MVSRHQLHIELASALESISEGVALFDAEDRLVTCNARYREILKASEEKISPGMPFVDILREQIRTGQLPVAEERLKTFMEQRLKSHLAPGDPFELKLGDGHWVRVQERRTAHGGIITVLTDITERKLREKRLQDQAEELERFNRELIRENELRESTQTSLRDSEARARAIFESAADGVITYGGDCVIERVNPATERIFGYRAKDLVGKKISLLLPCEECVKGGVAICDLRARPARTWGGLHKLQGVRKDGTRVPVEWTVSETELAEKRIFTAIVRDITEREKLEKMRSEFVSVVGHELRTPLTSIKGSLALLESAVTGELPPKAAGMITIAYKNTERLVRLINDILDIEKIESGTMPFEFQPVKLTQLLDQAADTNSAYADQFHVTILRESVPASAVVVADPDRVMQVLTNLISNAAKFSPPGGVVTLAGAIRGKMARISVTDQGPGIPEQFRDAIFEKFMQADASDSRKLGGTGLGLSIAKAIVERHGGRICFDTGLGKGTTFHFDLPAWRPRGRRAGSRRTGRHRQNIKLFT